MGKFKRLLVSQMVSFYDLALVSAGHNRVVDRMLAETRKALLEGLIQSGYVTPTFISEIAKQRKVSNAVLKAGFGAVKLNPSGISGVADLPQLDNHDEDSPDDAEDENPECLQGLADMLRHVTFRVKLIAEVVRRQEGGALYAGFRTFINESKATLATVSCTSHTSRTAEGKSLNSVTSPPDQPKHEENLVESVQGKSDSRDEVVAADPDPSKNLDPVPLEQYPHPGCNSPRRHFRDWRRDGFRCTCGCAFSSLNELDYHVQNSVELPLRISCRRCNFSGRGQCCGNYHTKEMHQDIVYGPYDCYPCRYGCEKWFPTKLKLRQHQRDTGRACLYSNATMLPPRGLSTKILKATERLGDGYCMDAEKFCEKKKCGEDGETACKDNLLEGIKSMTENMEMVILKQEPAAHELESLETTLTEAIKKWTLGSQGGSDQTSSQEQDSTVSVEKNEG